MKPPELVKPTPSPFPTMTTKPPAVAAPTPTPTVAFGSASLAPKPLVPAQQQQPPVATIPSAPATTAEIQPVKPEFSGASYQRAIDEEMRSFQKDLVNFKARAASLELNIGSSQEKAELKVNAETMYRFGSDLGEITASQNREVGQLQNDTLEGFQWAEEAKSREIRNKDPRYTVECPGFSFEKKTLNFVFSGISVFLRIAVWIR
jgi:hypothetical protein